MTCPGALGAATVCGASPICLDSICEFAGYSIVEVIFVNNGQNSYPSRVPVEPINDAVNSCGSIEDSESKEVVRASARSDPTLDRDSAGADRVFAMCRTFLDQPFIGVGFLEECGYNRQCTPVRSTKLDQVLLRPGKYIYGHYIQKYMTGNVAAALQRDRPHTVTVSSSIKIT